MRHLLFLICLSIGLGTDVLADPLMLEGSIGDYSIEMEITKKNPETGVFNGRYRYIGKENYLEVKGMIFGNCLQITESYNEAETGEFYLTIGDTLITGKWVGNSKWYDVSLKVKSGDISLIEAKSLKDYSAKTNDAITGSYGDEYYFVNDMWIEEGAQVEIGFNGGYAVVEELGGDSIAFQVEAVCGPTYHLAYAAGVAHKSGDFYLYKYDESCEIKIKFSKKAVHFKANASYECGFGARAYLDHDFTKINDGVNFGENISLSDLKLIKAENSQEKK